MNSATTRYSDTDEGRSSAWVRGFVPGQRAKEIPAPDFQGAVESIGLRKASMMMREEEFRGE